MRQDAPAVCANLLNTPTPGVANLQACGKHVCHRLQPANAAQQHFFQSHHRKLRMERKIRHHNALQDVCNTISMSSHTIVLAYDDSAVQPQQLGPGCHPTIFIATLTGEPY